MSNGIDISVAADTRSAMSAISRGVIDPLEDVAELLEKMGDESKDSGRDLERSMRAAQRRTEDASDEIRDLRDELNRAGRAAKDVGDDGVRGFRRLGDKGAEVSGELRQNLGETFSSFRGDLEDLPQIAQDTLGGLAGSGALGGIAGLAATAAGAAGLGLIIGAIQNIQAESEQMKEAVKENFREMASEGVEAWESTQAQMRRLTEAYAEHEGEIDRIAELTGLNFETVAAAWAGNKDAIDTVNRAYGEQVDELGKIPGATKEATDATVRGWESIMAPLNNTLSAYDTAKEKAEQLAKQQSDTFKAQIEDLRKVQVEVDEVGNQLVTLPDGTKVLIDVETGRATQNLDKFKGDFDGKVERMDGRTVSLSIHAVDHTRSEVDRIVRRINQRRASIGVNVYGIGGRSVE